MTEENQQVIRSSSPGIERTIGLWGATTIGVGAIVGGGILVLAGVALGAAGPSAMLAFLLNGFVAVLTALSFAELSSSFPESGGAYVFARKVLGIRPAFVVGWILWFAYIVAGVLYALGFAEYFLASVRDLWPGSVPLWLSNHTAVVLVALCAAGYYTVRLLLTSVGGGAGATKGKVLVFLFLIGAGLVAYWWRPDPVIRNGLSPFFAGGTLGLITAMGFTFIAMQGFEIIAAVGGEVKEPSKTIPRAMLYSLGIALAIYLPLLFIVSTAGVPPGGSIQAMSQENPETVMATAVRTYLGPTGFWLVMLAAILSTLSALQANILAASRVALTMAKDRTLPPLLSEIHAARKTPVMALYATILALGAILLMVPDLASAGAAASLIFLLCFALGHAVAFLARRRVSARDDCFQSPGYPWVQWIGGGTCIVLAIYQGIAVPAAGGITIVWLGLGVLLYLGLFSNRAAAVDASASAADPELLKLRGYSPTILVPIANPASAEQLVPIASALAPPRIGQVLLLNVVNPYATDHGDPIQAGKEAVGAALRTSIRIEHAPQALITVSENPWAEIRRVARTYRCHGVLFGRAQFTDTSVQSFESMLNSIESSVSFLFANPDWLLSKTRRLVIPVGGKSSHYAMRARLLGALTKGGERQVLWLRVVPQETSAKTIRTVNGYLRSMAEDVTPFDYSVQVVSSDNPVKSILELVQPQDLLILGLQEVRGKRVFGPFITEIIKRVKCATLVIAHGDDQETFRDMVAKVNHWFQKPE